MLINLRRALVASLLFLALLGFGYPLVEVGIGQAAFSATANGSLTPYGSTLIGQRWLGPRWFQGRPDTDNPMASGGSNLGPRSEQLVKSTKSQIAALEKMGIAPTSDLVTSSGSGVDPDISPRSAFAQVDAVAKARGLAPATVRALVVSQIHQAQFGFLGSSYVNVLTLNISLSRLQ